ncbi:MAG: SulP family inorganic anion transporter [Kineosporiaceae bacterium]|nr:SulP family inorganic anion transporter [Kineosporiaceae bacterium]MBK7623782.1 SulP family inorganic anion transporter [Kineosporiaceae bacterium]MBK8075658.1 SulP family inorganic anion transporter [Kineosporiaceae bacterium]
MRPPGEFSLRAPSLPGIEQLRSYKREFAPGDLLAGLLVAALAVPQALGYATVAGVPVQVGLYTLPPALLAYFLFGSSRLLFVGPVSTVTVLSGTIVRQLAGDDVARAADLTSALALTAGVILLLAGLLKIGWVAQFLNEPIVTGFVTGLVVLVIVGEIPGLLGLKTPSGALIDRVWVLITTAHKAQPTTLLVALAALLVLFGGQYIAPRLPWSLVVLVGGIAASRILDLSGHGARVVGSVPNGVPLPQLPVIELSQIGSLITGGAAIAAVGIAEGLAAAKTFSSSGAGDEGERLKDDSELVANGAADIASALFGGMGVAGSLSKTAANARAGARTQVSSLAAAAAVLLVLLFATGLIAPLPKAVLSAIVIHAVWGLLHPKEFARYRKVRRNDGLAAVVAFGGVLVLGPLNGLLLAIAQSLAGLVYRSMQVNIDEMGKVPGEKAAWGSLANDSARKRVRRICVLRPDGPIFWANAGPVFDRIRDGIDARPDALAVLLDIEASNQMDTTAAEQLRGLIRELHDRHVELYLVRVFGNVRAVLDRAGVLDELGEGRIWHSISAGVKSAKQSPAFVAARAAAAAEAAMDEASDYFDELDDTDLDGYENIASRWREVGALAALHEFTPDSPT